MSFESDEKDINIPVGLVRNLCNAYAHARGISIFFGSGDGGVAGVQDKKVHNVRDTFPSSYPFGTSSFGLEVGFSFSASGFFNVFPRPNYQEDAAVSAYLHHLGNKNEGLFKTANRAFPDIAALAQSFQVVHERADNIRLRDERCKPPSEGFINSRVQ